MWLLRLPDFIDCPCRCGCGRFPEEHDLDVMREARLNPPIPSSLTGEPERWQVKTHTREVPTTAFGTVEFQGGPHPTKARVRQRRELVDLSLSVIAGRWLSFFPPSPF